MSIAINTGDIGGINDYTSLVDTITLWLDRDDLSVQIPTFIRLIEPYLNRVLRTPDMDAMATPMLVDGGFAIPTDCLQIRAVYYAGKPLDSLSPSSLLGQYMTNAGILNGVPMAYSVTGARATIAPSATGVVMMTYWQRIPALTPVAPSNWLLSSHPDVYLYGALAQAEGYIENPDRAAQWTALFDASVKSLIEAAAAARFGGPVRARAVTQVVGTVA